ncbi:unnamed protein product [Closterium sp. NIES-65]|nr:unnamed protein product [Closterium sp. NIES-65]
MHREFSRRFLPHPLPAALSPPFVSPRRPLFHSSSTLPFLPHSSRPSPRPPPSPLPPLLRSPLSPPPFPLLPFVSPHSPCPPPHPPLRAQYMMVARHLSSIEQIVVALTESITEQAGNEAHDMRVLVGALENHTLSVATALTDHVALQTSQLRQLATEIRNHSATVQTHVATAVDAIGGGGEGGRGGGDVTKEKLAVLISASARSQRKTEAFLSSLLTSVKALSKQMEVGAARCVRSHAMQVEQGGAGGAGGAAGSGASLMGVREAAAASRKQLLALKTLQESMEDLKSRQSTTDYSPQVLPSGTPTGASSGSSSGASSGAPLRCFPQVLPSGASLRCFPQVLPSGASLTCFPQGRVVEVWLLGAVVPSRRARGRTRMLAVLKALVAHIKAATTNASPSLQLPRAAGLGRTPHLHSGGAQGVGGMAHIKAARANGGPGGMSHLIRILGVLKALVAHIKAATANGGLGLGLGEQLPQLPSLDMDVSHLEAMPLQPQAQVSAQQAQQMERLLQQVLAEVRNGTHLTLLLRAVSTQTTILSRLAKRFSSLQSAAFSANTAAATPPPAGPDAAAGGGGAAVKSLQGLVAMVLQNSQKHMSALRDVKRMLTGEEADGKGGYSVPVRTLAVVQESARALQQMPALLMQLDRRLQGVGGGAGGGVAGGGGGGGGARAEGVVVGGGGAGTGMRQQQQGQVVSAMEPPKLSGRAARHERLKQLMAKEAAARAAKQKEEEAAAAGKAAAAAAAGDTQGEGAGGQKEEGGQEQRTVEGAGQQQQEQQQGGVAAGMGAAGGAGAGGGGGDDRGGGEQGRVVLPLPLMVWREGRAGEWGERQVGMLKGRSKREERRGGSAEERGVMGKVAWMARGGELRGRLGKEMEEGRGEGLEQVEGGGKQRLEVRKERVEGNQRGEGKEGEQGEKGAQGGGGGAGGVVPIEWAKPEEMDSERADLVSMLKARRDEAGERGSEDSGVKSGGGGEAVKHRRKRKKHKGGEGRGAVGGGGKGEGEMSEEERAMAEARMAVSRERGEDEEEEEEEEGEGEGEEGEEEGEEGEEEGGEDEEKGGGKGKGEGGVKSGVGRKRRVAGGERGEAGSGELKERGGRRGGEGESKRRLGEEGRGAQGGGARGGGGNGGGGVGEGGGGEGSVARQGRRKRIPMEQAEEQQSMGAGARTGLRLKSMGIEELLSLEDEEDDEEEGAGGGGGGGAGGGTMGRMGGEGGVEVAGEGGRSSGWGEGREGQQGQGIKLGVGGRGGGVGAAARVGKAVLDDVEGEEAWTEPLPTQGYIPQGPFANASEWRQRVLAGNSVFTRFSGYRVGPRRLVGVGVVPRAMKGRLFATHCRWFGPAQLALDCTVNVSYSLGQQGSASQHTEAVIEAAFSEDVPNTGGFLAVRIEGTDFVLYREAPLTFPTTTPGLPFPFHSVFCLLPSARNASVPVHLLREAVEYHRLLGAAVVALYDSGGWLAVELTERFHGDFERRVVRRTDFTGVKQFDLERNGQVLAMHDCVQRHAFTARWVIPAAINEFLFVGLPPASIPSFLDPFAYPPTSSSETALSDPLVDSAVTGAAAAVTASGGSAAAAAEAAAYVRAVPWVSVGSQWWSTRLCALPFRVPEGEAFSMERMVFRWPYPVCHDRIRFPDPHLCPGEAGFRRLIMDPRKISALGLHEAESASRVRGVHVRSTKANFNHLQDAVMDPTAWCEHTLLKNEVPEFYVRDVYLREAAQSVRAGRVCDFTRGRVSPSLPSLPARPPCSPSLLSLPALPPCSPSLLSLPALPPCSPSLPSLPALPPCSPSLRLRPWPGLKARSTPHVQRFCNCLLFLFNCCLHSLLKLKRFEGGKVAA